MAHHQSLKEVGEKSWGYSSAGRAPALQAGCQRFKSAYLHHLYYREKKEKRFSTVIIAMEQEDEDAGVFDSSEEP